MNTKVTTAMEHGTGYKTATFIGGIVGLVGYLAIGLLPSIVYGGFAGVTLAAALFGTPIDASWMARGVVVFGMVVGLLATAALFVVVGAAMGAGFYSVAGDLGRGKEPAEAKIKG
jgi:hypothetical protein